MPQLADDYYLNLVDWGANNTIAVALGSSVYLWSATSARVTKLCDVGPDDDVTAVAWAPHGNAVAVGTNSGRLLLWDAHACAPVRALQSHASRVGVIAWSAAALASGSRDRSILLQARLV